jgi:putative glycerol-1-phosphate prenyltransferase
MGSLYNQIIDSNKKHLAVLVDPDKTNIKQVNTLFKYVEKSRIDFVLVGSSLNSFVYESYIESIKNLCHKPIPGNGLQLSSKADALLNLSLISGRNPEYLIGEHVKTAHLVKTSGLEVIPTGYMLIDGGTKTSAAYISNTQAIPHKKIDIAVATALAGQLLGLKAIYLEAGSGATYPVSDEMIKAVCDNVELPIICGGGIKTKLEVEAKWEAGADVVVIGTAFEQNPELIKAFY